LWAVTYRQVKSGASEPQFENTWNFGEGGSQGGHNDGPSMYSDTVFDTVCGYGGKRGYGRNGGLRAVTINAAELTGIADRVGSIEVGKDADIAIYDGHPFDIRSKVSTTLLTERLFTRGRNMKEIRTCSQEDTIEFGKKLGVLLKKGDIVCITGDLGTGKTVLTNGIASALGIDEYITSPTFTIVNEYEKGDISFTTLMFTGFPTRKKCLKSDLRNISTVTG